MPQVVIQFEGICVNFKKSDFPFLPAAHRIVLINASNITQVWGNTISPHAARFSLGSLTADTEPLNGSIVQIANPDPVQTVTYDASYAGIPSLRTLTPLLGPAWLAVLTGHNPALTACYFDIDHGVIGSIGSDFGAAMTVVTIETIGDPMYQLTPIPEVLSSIPVAATQWVPATDKMFFSNGEAPDGQSHDNDFLLSYLVVSPPPVETPALPAPIGGNGAPNFKSELAKLLNLVYMTDLGCSNSAYP